MPGDPEECRKHARNCLQLAEASTNAEITRTFVDLAHSWTRRALDLESAQALCGATPRTDEELSLSLILCRQLSPEAQLAQFAQQIRSGSGVQIPESLLAPEERARKSTGGGQGVSSWAAGSRLL
jgi:hypothetical protein